MSYKVSSLVASAAFLFLSTYSLAADQRTIHIQVIGNSKFDVIYHRAKSDGTGAAIGGLLGAGIQAGVESEKDNKKRTALSPSVTQNPWNDAFTKALDDTLTENDYQVKWIEKTGVDDKEKADIYLTLYPGTHGLRMVDSSTQLASAYIDFRVSYSTEIGKGAHAEKETFYLTGKRQASYDDILAAPESFNDDLQTVHAQAAKRLANKLIYNVKR